MPEPEVKSSVTVVTSENLLEFQNKKIDEQTPAVAEEPEPVEEKKDARKVEIIEEEEPEDPRNPRTPEQKAASKKEKLNLRFSELTEKNKASEEKARLAVERAEAAERRAAELDAKLNPPPPEDLGPEPKVDQFQNTEEYAKALKEWAAETTKRDLNKETQEKTYKEQREKVITAWVGKVDAVKKEMPDYEAKIGASTVKVSDQMRDAILESDVGPKILYHFAEHPEDAERIGKLTVGGALRELGRLEERLAKEPANPVTKSPVLAAVAEVSKAPAPITALKGSGTPVLTRVDSNGVYHGTYAQYKKDRAAGKIK